MTNLMPLVVAYQTAILTKDEWVYHKRHRPCHSSAWLSSRRSFVWLREEQALKIGGRRCKRCWRE